MLIFAEISIEGQVLGVAAILGPILGAVGLWLGNYFSFRLKLEELKIQAKKNAETLGTVAVNQEVAAAKAVEVKVALTDKATEVKTALAQASQVVARKLDAITEASAERTKLIVENTDITKSVLSFVNGPLTAERRQVAQLARWKADHTGKPEDIRSAEEAEERLRQAIERQLAGGDSGIISSPKSN